MSTRREEIVGVAARLFAKKGFLGTTVREIADNAGVLSGSLYHHFDSKEAIAGEILSGYYEGMVDRFRAIVQEADDEADALGEMIRVAFRGIAEQSHAVALIRNSGEQLLELERFAHIREINDELARIARGVLERGVSNGVLKPEVDPHLTWTFIRDAMSGVIVWWDPDGKYSIDDIAEHYIEMIYDGLVASSPRSKSRANSKANSKSATEKSSSKSKSKSRRVRRAASRTG